MFSPRKRIEPRLANYNTSTTGTQVQLLQVVPDSLIAENNCSVSFLEEVIFRKHWTGNHVRNEKYLSSVSTPRIPIWVKDALQTFKNLSRIEHSSNFCDVSFLFAASKLSSDVYKLY